MTDFEHNYSLVQLIFRHFAKETCVSFFKLWEAKGSVTNVCMLESTHVLSNSAFLFNSSLPKIITYICRTVVSSRQDECSVANSPQTNSK